MKDMIVGKFRQQFVETTQKTFKAEESFVKQGSQG